MRKTIVIATVLLCAMLAVGGMLFYQWGKRPLSLAAEVVDVHVASGDGASAIARRLRASGADTSDLLLRGWLRVFAGRATFKAGTYEVTRQDSPQSVAHKIAAGKTATRKVRIGEGWTFARMRSALATAESLQPTTQGMSDAQIMAALGHPGQHPEGQFFPDTYVYPKGAPDIQVYQMALRTMQRKLDAAWNSRAPDLPISSPYELLTLASIVEKETGHHADRARVAAVFENRLRIGMRLQTDPTVIYGMGDSYTGKIRRSDLQTDTPYNTYTRAGLPPTPIALPGEAALAAAANPAETRELYFVSRGDGTSEFSTTLEAHNRAVDKYIRNRR